MNKYEQWISKNIMGDGYGECHKYCKEMKEVFPELEIKKGFYYDFQWGERMHGWLVDPEGNIVDPTKNQYPSRGNGKYVELKEEELPTGMCPNCGELIFDGKYTHKECHDAYVASLMS